jgi:uncharacterized membrane protein YccC
MVDELECVASVLLAIAFGHLSGAHNISWAAFSGYMVMRGHVSASFLRGLLRIAGTGLGAGLALAVTPHVLESPALAGAAMGLVGAVSLYFALTGRRSYAWLFVGLTFAMVMLDKLEHPGLALWPFVHTRVIEVIAGTSACVVVSAVSTLTLRRRWPAAPLPTPQRLGWRPAVARHCALAGVALSVLPGLHEAAGVPQLAQAAVTIMAVMMAPVSAIGDSAFWPVNRRILLRAAGCLAGVAMAGGFVILAYNGEYAAWAAPILVAGTILGVAIGRHIENGQGSIAYGGLQFTLVVLVALVPDSYAHADLAPAVHRLISIFIGFAILEPVLLAWHFLAPGRRRKAEAQAESTDI